MKKDLGLFLLIVVVAAVTAYLNPRFISPINISNTANLTGLFGLYAIGEGLVIITGGIDVGSKAEIYTLMRGLADSGVAVLMISSDLEEVIGVSDRVAVMREGAISGFLERAELGEEAIMRLATDSQSEQVH